MAIFLVLSLTSIFTIFRHPNCDLLRGTGDREMLVASLISHYRGNLCFIILSSKSVSNMSSYRTDCPFQAAIAV